MPVGEDAFRRIVPDSAEGIFAPLGETLVWLVATDDLLDAADGRLPISARC